MRTHDYNETDQPTILATYIYIEGKKKKKKRKVELMFP